MGLSCLVTINTLNKAERDVGSETSSHPVTGNRFLHILMVEAFILTWKGQKSKIKGEK